MKQFSFTLDQGRKSHCVPIFKEGRRKANPELGLIENEEDMVSTNLLHFDSTFFITKLRRNFLINRYLARMRLLLILQRYSNLSKSQRATNCCIQLRVVTYTAKVLKFKQITTQRGARGRGR